MVYDLDSKSSALNGAWGFDSPSRHSHDYSDNSTLLKNVSLTPSRQDEPRATPPTLARTKTPRVIAAPTHAAL